MRRTHGGGFASSSWGSATYRPPPSSMQWVPTFPMQPPHRPRAWSALVLAAIAVLLGGAALVVALTRQANSSPAISASTSSISPTFTPEETAAAHQKLCDAYKLAARSIDIDTNTDNRALADAVSVNAAVLLQQAISAAPAISSGDRAAALRWQRPTPRPRQWEVRCSATIPSSGRRSMMSMQKTRQ